MLAMREDEGEGSPPETALWNNEVSFIKYRNDKYVPWWQAQSHLKVHGHW